jgi:hypothetical protein
MHAVAHRSPHELFVEREDIVAADKCAAEGAAAEVKICLGWRVDTRKLILSLPHHKFLAWDTDLKSLLRLNTISHSTLESIIGKLENIITILKIAGHFMNNLYSLLIKLSTSPTHCRRLSASVKDDISLHRQFLRIAKDGISMNLLTYRQSTHAIIGDASEYGLGAFHLESGRGWAWYIPQHLQGRAHINLLEFLTQLIQIWVDIIEGRIHEEDCILAMGDNTTAMGWLRRSNFRETNEDGNDWKVKQEVARKVATLVLDAKTCHLLQEQFRGYKNADKHKFLAALKYTNTLCTKTQTVGSCTLSCDNKGALAASFGWKTPNPNWKCFDIVSMIRLQLRNAPIQWNYSHVKGHQDDEETFTDLDSESQANVIADEQVKEEWKKEIIPRISNADGQPWTITCQGTILTGNVEKRLRHILYEEKMKKWWMEKCNLEIQEEELIDWEAYASFRKLTPRWRNTWAVKYGAGLLPTGHNLQRRGHSNTSACPWCNEEIETTNHIFQCKHLEMAKGFDDELDKIDDFLRGTTSNAIREAVIQLLHGLRDGEIDLADDTTDLSHTVKQQFDLGQKATLNGMWLKKWTSYQRDYLTAIGSRKRARVWVTQLALSLQTMMHNMWKMRNEAIHKAETSAFNNERNSVLDQKIEELFSNLPQLRLFRPSDRAIFRKKKERIKKYRIVNKEN